MTNRIAPPGDYPKHGNAIMFLNQLSTELKLLNAGEGTGVLLELTREWSIYKTELWRCSGSDFGGLRIDDLPPRVKAHVVPHAAAVEFVDVLIRDIESLWSWPPPKDFRFDPLRIDQLRVHIHELEGCRGSTEIKY